MSPVRREAALRWRLPGRWRARRAAMRRKGRGPQRDMAPSAPAKTARMEPLWRSRRIGGKAFVDLQNDVTAADMALAVREGFGNSEHLKRYTTLGMATDQGKSGALTGQAIMAALTGRSPRHHIATHRAAAGSAGGHRRLCGIASRQGLPAGAADRRP